MIINMILYDNDATARVNQKSYDFFDKVKCKRFCENSIWLDGMNIEFYKRIVTINIYSDNSDWKKIINEYLEKVFVNEEVYINYNEVSQYYKSYSESSLRFSSGERNCY